VNPSESAFEPGDGQPEQRSGALGVTGRLTVQRGVEHAREGVRMIIAAHSAGARQCVLGQLAGGILS